MAPTPFRRPRPLPSDSLHCDHAKPLAISCDFLYRSSTNRHTMSICTDWLNQGGFTMKRMFAGLVLVASFAITGCIAKMTGPGGAGADVSKMKLVETECFIHVLGYGPFGNAVIKTNKVDAIQYSFENYVVWGRVCAEAYK